MIADSYTFRQTKKIKNKKRERERSFGQFLNRSFGINGLGEWGQDWSLLVSSTVCSVFVPVSLKVMDVL